MQPSDATVAATQPRRAAGARPYVVGALAAALAIAALAQHGVGREGLVAAFTTAVLVVLSSIDLERRILPNGIVLPSAAFVLALQVALAPGRAGEWLLCAGGAALLLALPLVVNRAAIGLGDVKLGLLLGAALGSRVFGALALGFLLLFPVALAYLLRHGKGARTDSLPLGPFLAAGAAITLLAGS